MNSRTSSQFSCLILQSCDDTTHNCWGNCYTCNWRCLWKCNEKRLRKINCKFSIQRQEFVVSVSAILMVYERYSSKINHIHQTINAFLYAEYLNYDGRGGTIFRCVQEYCNKYDIPLGSGSHRWGTCYGGALSRGGIEWFYQILLHTKVRSLSRGLCLKTLVELFDKRPYFLAK